MCSRFPTERMMQRSLVLPSIPSLNTLYDYTKFTRGYANQLPGNVTARGGNTQARCSRPGRVLTSRLRFCLQAFVSPSHSCDDAHKRSPIVEPAHAVGEASAARPSEQPTASRTICPGQPWSAGSHRSHPRTAACAPRESADTPALRDHSPLRALLLPTNRLPGDRDLDTQDVWLQHRCSTPGVPPVSFPWPSNAPLSGRNFSRRWPSDASCSPILPILTRAFWAQRPAATGWRRFPSAGSA